MKLIPYKELQRIIKRDELVAAIVKDRQEYVDYIMDRIERLLGPIKIERKK